MKRLVDYYLQSWKVDLDRKPLLLRGARQVGKTYAVRQLGKTFEEFVEINFEQLPHIAPIFEQDLVPERILRDLSLTLKKTIIPGRTLLFFDEVQAAPQAVLALRYFYEQMPELHIIAAGSLLDFAIEQVGVPVGRVQFLYMFPLSFFEFLAALNDARIIEAILKHELEQEISEVIHHLILRRVGEYIALGGMPYVVKCWQTIKDPLKCAESHSTLLDAYRQDFNKYAKKHQIKYLEFIFSEIPRQLGEKFKYSTVEGQWRKRELSPAFELLRTAGVVHKVYATTGQGSPLGALADPWDDKGLFIDVGLAQAELKLDLAQWFLNPLQQFANQGHIIEAFVGQEILAYSNPYIHQQLYYWHREKPSSAEVDYIIQDEYIIPIEVKSGTSSRLKSLRQFLNDYPKTPYGIRFSSLNYSNFEQLHSYPLYAIAPVIAQDHMLKAIASLL